MGEATASRKSSATGVSAVLVINCGSSSIKFALFAAEPTTPPLTSGAIERIGLAAGRFYGKDSAGNVLFDEQHPVANHKVALTLLIKAIKQQLAGRTLLAVGHRVVHGGHDCDCPLPVTKELEARPQPLIPLAPLHLTLNLAGIAAMRELKPDLPQIACMMADQGFLDTRQMAGAFQILRSNDLVWSSMVQSYLKGERPPMFDLMAWNADATRMPYRMHSEYLRRLFLNNALATGHFEVERWPVSLHDIRAPIFAVSTMSDHVAPRRSVYKIQALTDADVTFVLSNGGHNAGIVNPPGRPNRKHQIATHTESENYVAPDAWHQTAVRHEGSRWPCWQNWLVKHSSPDRLTPSGLGAPSSGYTPVCDAPGAYVLRP